MITGNKHLEEVKICPVCGNTKFKKLFKAKDYNQKTKGSFGIIQCNSCKTSLTSPRPKKKYIGNYYPQEYWGDSSTPRAEILNNYREIYKWIIENSKKSNNKILDIGAGGGYFLSLFDEKFDKIGVEYSAKAALMGSKKYNLKILNGDLEKCSDKLTKRSFDFITMNNVLEHVYSPKKELNIIKNLLNKNGVVIISVPNFGSLNRLIFNKYWYHLDPPRHINHFDGKNLSSFLENNGFKVIRVDYKYYVHNEVGFKNSFLNKKTKINRVQNKFINKTSSVIAKISPIIKKSDVVTIYAINETKS